jgi:predicted amidohydrolase
MKEGQVFRPGQEPPPVYAYQNHRIGVMICFDWAFPEMARVLALSGAQLILHPSNLVLPYCMDAMLTRSIENRVFTATANRTGLERGTLFSGSSQITSPLAARIAQAGREFSGVIAAEVDLAQADDKWITPYNHVIQDRRPDLYDPCPS